MTDEYISYEYKTLTIPEKMRSTFLNDYACFGWTFDSQTNNVQTTHLPHQNQIKSTPMISISWKRDRHIPHRQEFVRLQTNYDDCLMQQKKLQEKKILFATLAAISIGLLGVFFLLLFFLSLFHHTRLSQYQTWLLSIPGLILCLLPALSYQRMLKHMMEKLDPIIQKKRDEMDTLCRKGHKLIQHIGP